jgi:hypothetical protein
MMEAGSWHRVAAMSFRTMAEGTTDPKANAIMLRIAERHEKIAAHLAEMGPGKD